MPVAQVVDDLTKISKAYGIAFHKEKFDWYDTMINHRMPPDSLYLNRPRPIDDYVYLAKKGVKWFGLLDVQNLPPTTK